MKIIIFCLLTFLWVLSGDTLAQKGYDDNVQFVLGCVAPERVSCGCSIRVAGVSCPKQNYLQVHFFSELLQGAPLLINCNGQEVSLSSMKPPEPIFNHDRGDSWIEEYRNKDMSATIQYHPADSTCPPGKGADGCEYFDVAADIMIKMNNGTIIRYSGLGTCGC